MKKLFLLLAAVLSLTQMMAQTVPIAIGTGTSTNSSGPIPGLWGNHRSIQLFTAAEFGQTESCVIERIDLELGSVTAGSGGRNVRIYMKEVPEETVASTQILNSLTTGATLVYSSVDEVCTSNTWHTFLLETPFVYSGESSLVVIFEGEGCTTNGGCYVNVKGTNGTNKAWTICWDETAPDFTTPIEGITTPIRTNMRFYIAVTEGYCYPVSGLTPSNLTTDGADISWTSEESNFEYQYKLAFETWESENVVSGTTTSTSVSLSGLNSSSRYDFRVKTICSDGESSWVNCSFNTACDVITAFPWFEGFESNWNNLDLMTGTITAPYCWLNINGGGSSYKWGTTSTSYEGSTAAYMYGYSSSSATLATYKNDDWLITPVLELTGNEVLSFYTKKSSTSYTPELRIYAYALTDGDMTSVADTANFVAIDSITDLTTSYAERELSLESLVGQYRLAFVRNKTIGHGSVFLDNVMVKAALSCARPDGLVTTGVTDSEISVTWNEVEGVASYNLYYKTGNAADWTVVPVTENSYTLSELPAATAYTINVTAVCGDGTETGFPFDPPLSVATLCSADRKSVV